MPTPTLPSRRPAFFLSAAVAACAAMAMLGMPSLALAAAGTNSTLASFLQNIIADADYDSLDGPDGPAIVPMIVGASGYSYTLGSTSSPGVFRRAIGIAAEIGDQGLVFTFSGRPVSAFACTFKISPSFTGLPVNGGNLVVQTNTGLSFPVTVPAGGTFFGFTSTEPFTSVTIADAAGVNFEFVDDVYVGTAITATDQCLDARTISPTTAAAYPFVTGGNTAETISGVCDSAIDTGADVWFRFVAPVQGMATFGTCGCTFDSILRVFPSCPVGGSGAGQIACNDDFCAGGGVGQNRGSQVSFRTVAGEDYLIRVSGYNGASGSGNLTFSLVPDCTADFNHSGGKEVQDIFDFLSAWFGGC